MKNMDLTPVTLQLETNSDNFAKTAPSLFSLGLRFVNNMPDNAIITENSARIASTECPDLPVTLLTIG